MKIERQLMAFCLAATMVACSSADPSNSTSSAALPPAGNTAGGIPANETTVTAMTGADAMPATSPSEPAAVASMPTPTPPSTLPGAPAAGGATATPSTTTPMMSDAIPLAGMTADMTTSPEAEPGNADPSVPASDACDRACLLEYVQKYIDALEANDPSLLPVAANLRYTENGVESPFDGSKWPSVSEIIPNSRLDFADPVQKNGASQFALRDSRSTLVRYSVRIKVENAEVTEIEAMAARGGESFIWSEGNIEPNPVFFETPKEPNTREELIKLTHLYIDYLEGNLMSPLPASPTSERWENGVRLVSNGAFREQWFFVVEPRRISVVDEEMGITFGNLPFGGTPQPEPLVVGEAFKIWGGEFQMIQAVMRNQPDNYWTEAGP